MFVFLDGDGNSWIEQGRVSEDPTPRNPIALDLLAAEDSCGIYLSRPCTFGLAKTDPGCNAIVWTLDRYSEPVLQSLEAALARVVPEERNLILVGYSGGGLLASHLANRISRVQGVITLAANLDLRAWVDHHGYLDEIVSRSPPPPIPMRRGLVQLHVIAGRDRISPASISLKLLKRDERSRQLVLPDADHTCCWVRNWNGIREKFSDSMAESEIREFDSPTD